MKASRPFLYLLLAVIISIPVMVDLWPEFLWPVSSQSVDLPLHSALEAFGAVSAVIMAVFLLQRSHEEEGGGLFTFALGFLGMGLMDGFHSALSPGHGFVLLRAVASLTGGFWFSMVYFPAVGMNLYLNRWLPRAVVFYSVALGVWASFFRETLPAMVGDGTFTPLAKDINLVAGFLFIAAAARLLFVFHRSGNMESYLFGCLALLFGMSNLMFVHSTLWDQVWYFWHLLRIAAYAVVLSWLIQKHHRTLHNLREALAERKELEKQRADFYAMVTHDIKSPLTAILGYSEFMLVDKSDKLEEEIKEMVEAIHRNGGRLLNMVEDFLAVSRMEAGRLELNVRHFNLSEILEDSLNDIKPSVEEKGLLLKYEIPEGMPEVVLDKKLIYRAVSNLLGNAVNYTKRYDSITLKAEAVSQGDGRFLVISVADTGPGIPPEDKAKVFEKYYRSRMSEGVKGSGLGLAIVKAVAEAHGGRVELDSEVGKGSTFRLVLPMNGAGKV